MHPHRLHATAALWSLRAARRRLHHELELSDRGITIDPTVSLRSPRYGSRHGSGGHSDPIGDALISATRRTNRWERLATSTTDTLTWLACKLGAAGPGDPLGRLLTATPGLRPAAAADLHRWVLEADHDLRKALGVGLDHQPLEGNPACPACGLQMLVMQTSAPDTIFWTIVCTAGEVCTGDTCPCGMETRAAGVGHIWADALWREATRLAGLA